MQTINSLYNSEFLNSLDDSQKSVVEQTKKILKNWVKTNSLNEPCVLNESEIRETILSEIDRLK